MKTYIVIVDECELIKVSLIKTLPEYANSIMFYDNLQDALNAISDVKEQRKYIFIVDLEFATNDGVKELTKKVPEGYCSIIILTSMPVNYVENMLHEVGIVKIFVKPFNVKELSETILKLCKQD